jgi:phage RecT family recombinase
MSSNSTAVATVTPLQRVLNTVASPQMQGIIQQALPPGVTLDRFTRATLTAIQQNPDILDCDRNSLYNAIARCAQDGLMPDGKQAAIVKFNTRVKVRNDDGTWGETYIAKAQHMPMVEGIIHLLGKADISAYAVTVYANDEIELWNDETGQHIRHRPTQFGKPRGERIGAIAVGRTKAGQVYVEAMTMEDLEVPKRATKQKNQKGELIGPWRETPDRMEQKSALHRLAKRMPYAALRDDDEFQEEADPQSMQGTVPAASNGAAAGGETPQKAARKTRSAALQAVVDAGGADPAPAAEPTEEQPKKDPEPAKQEEKKPDPEPAKPAAQPEKKPDAPKATVQQQGKEVF